MRLSIGLIVLGLGLVACAARIAGDGVVGGPPPPPAPAEPPPDEAPPPDYAPSPELASPPEADDEEAPRFKKPDPREDYIFAIGEATGDFVRPTVIRRLVTLEVGSKCWAKLLDKDMKGIYTGYALAQNIADWAKGAGGDDWWTIERKTGTEKEKIHAILDRKITAFRSRFHMTIAIAGDDCNPRNNSHHVTAWETISAALRDHPPKSGKAFITLTITNKAKKLSVQTSTDGTTFRITLPKDLEPDVWKRPIEEAFQKVSSK